MIRKLLWIPGSVVLLFIFLLVFGTLSDFRPEEKTLVFIDQSDSVSHEEGLRINLLNWNIGYCGLDASMDFFYDGGKQVRPSRENVMGNLNYVEEYLQKADSIDIFLLQEVDFSSKRSYKINQHDRLAGLDSVFHSSFGVNYKVPFVPLPPKSPMGRVHSGLMTISELIPSSVARFSFPGNYAWPMSVFMLDRCFLSSRYSLENGKELLVVNTHNSAYDDGGLRDIQTRYLRDFMLREYKKGNYILAGGDWNQCPPGFIPKFLNQPFDTIDHSEITPDLMPDDWKWVYDPSVPTNRRVKTPYRRGETLVTLIDYFLVSPNVEVLAVKGDDLDFAHSDHQPVRISVRLK